MRLLFANTTAPLCRQANSNTSIDFLAPAAMAQAVHAGLRSVPRNLMASLHPALVAVEGRPPSPGRHCVWCNQGGQHVQPL